MLPDEQKAFLGGLTIRTMTRSEIDLAVEWAAVEGWNPGLHDADAFYAADPTGFLIGLLGDEPVAVISAVKYGATFAFLGFYIVKPGHRGHGYGKQIWDAAMATLTGRTIGLDGVVAEQEKYRKTGFTLVYRNIRYQGAGGGNPPASADIVALATVPFADVLAYDRPFFPADREAFLRRWIQPPQGTALGLLEKGNLAGYGVIRACHAGHKIGPLFADSAAGAEALFLALKATIPASDSVYLDPPEANPAAVELARRHGMAVVFETARMYAGETPRLPLDRLFGVTSFELG